MRAAPGRRGPCHDACVSEGRGRAPRHAAHDERYVGLFWRLFIPNAIVLATVCVVLMVQPPQGRVPVLVAGLAVTLAVHLLIVRRAVAPLLHLTRLSREVDPLRPGQRLEVAAPPSEVTVLADGFNAMLDRLEQERSASERRTLRETEAERRRLAAELHDQIGQSLTAVALHLARTEREAPEPLRGELASLREEVLQAVDDVRSLARSLRPEALDTLGLVPALTSLTERLARHAGIEIRREIGRDLPALPDEAELALFRVAQESLTNALRHAGARRVTLRLHAVPGGVRLTVADDGAGLPADPPSGGGLTSMRERALAVGARLRIGPGAAGAGTEVHLDVPV
jgi:two-component system, NarL family, sensor histidine kinase UhpB